MDYIISTDKNLLDISLIHDYLCNKSYWASGRSIEDVTLSIANSWCIGVYNKDKQLLGFARVATDYVVFAWIMDVFVVDSCKGKGIGKMLINYIVTHDTMQKVNGIGLRTNDAHGLYEKFGFKKIEEPDTWMFRTKQ